MISAISGSYGTESQFEATTIERLRALGYQYQPAGDFIAGLRSSAPSTGLAESIDCRFNPNLI